MDTPIWIVTADANLRLKLPGLLQSLGYDHRLFKLPKSALHTLERNEPPALIIIDTTAVELLSRLRQKPKNVHLAVIVVAAEANEAYFEQLQQLGADAFLAKPVTAPALQKAMQVALQRRRAVAG